jgi:hypothetical protein
MFCAIMATLGEPRAFAAEVGELMTGVLNRAKSVQSGRLEYRFTFGRVGSEMSPLRQVPVRVFTFAGADWIERERDSGSASVSRGGCFLQYDEIQKPNGDPSRTALLQRSGTSNDWDAVNRRPRSAGTFWHTQQRKYVESHRTQIRMSDPSTIDGIDCEVCELDVPAGETTVALQVHSPSLSAGGKLRVHVAPQLGFVLPLIEVQSAMGAKVASFRSSDFLMCPDGTYFPRKTRREVRTPSGDAEYGEFTIVPELINQTIPASDFALTVPAGTRVRDERDAAQVRRFELTRDTTSGELAGVEDQPQPSDATEPTAVSPLKDLAIIIAVSIVCLFVAIRLLRSRT